MAKNNIVDSLAFDVLVKDNGFDQKLKKMEAVAKEFNITVSQALEIMSKMPDKPFASGKPQREIEGLKHQLAGLEKQWGSFNSAQRKGLDGQGLLNQYRTLKGEAGAYGGTLNTTVKSLDRATMASDKLKASQNGISNSIRKANSDFTVQGRAVSNLNTLFTTYVSLFAVERLVSNIARVRGEFELQQVALRAIIQDAQAADTVFSQIKGLAVESPFQFKELTGYVKQLAAFSIETDKLFDTTSRLADISAGLGVDMGRIILAYGQVRSASVLRGQELRQFTEAGIPLVDKLAKKFGELEGRVVSAGEVFEKISNRMVSFGMVNEILTDLTSEGGMFFDMQAKQAETLAGQLSNLIDAYEIMLNDIGQANDGSLKDGVGALRSLMENWREVMAVVGGVVVAYGTYKTATIVATALSSEYAASLGKVTTLESLRSNMIQKATPILNSQSVAMATYQAALDAGMSKEIAATMRDNMRSLSIRNKGAALSYQTIQQQLNTIAVDKNIASTKISTITDRVYTASVKSASTATVALGAAMKALAVSPNGILLIITALIGVATWAYNAYQASQKLNNELLAITSNGAQKAKELADNFKKLATEAVLAADGSEKQRESLGKLNSQYNEILGVQQITIESLRNMKDNYDQVTQAIYAKIEAQKLEEGIKTIEDEYGGDIKTDTSDLIKGLTNRAKLSARDATLLVDNYRKALDELFKSNPFPTLVDYANTFRDTAKNTISDVDKLNIVLGDTNLKLYNIGQPGETLNYSLYGKIARNVNELGESYQKVNVKIKEFSDTNRAISAGIENTAQLDAILNSEKAIAEATKKYEEQRKTIENSARVNNENQLDTNLKLHNLLVANQKETAKIKLDFGVIDQSKFEAEIAKIVKPLTGAKQVINEVIDSIAGLSDAEKYNFKIKADSTDSVQGYITALQEQKTELEKQIQLQLKLGGIAGVVKDLMAGGTGMPYSADTIIAGKNVIAMQTTASGIDKVSAALNALNKDIGGGSGKDAVAEKLKNQIELLKRAEGQYEKYLKIASKDDAIKNVRGDAQFKSLGVDFKDYSPKDTRKYLDQIYNSIKGNPRFKDAQKELEKLFTDLDYDKAKKVVDDFLSAIQSEIENYKSDFDFYQTVLGITGNKELSATIAFNATGTDVGEGLVDTLKKKLHEATKGEFSFDDLLKFSPEKLKELPDGIQKMFEETKKAIEKSTQDSYLSMVKLAADSVKEFAASQQQIEEIQKDFTKRREAVEQQRKLELQNASSEEEVNAINNRTEALLMSMANAEKIAIMKLSEDYMDFFSAINTMTLKTAGDLRQKLRSALYESFRVGAISANELRKELKAIDEQFDKLSQPQSNFAAYMSGGIDGLLNRLRETGNQVEVIGQEISKLKSIDDIPEKKMKFLKAAGIDVTEVFKSAGGNAEKAGGAISKMGSGMSEVAGQMAGAVTIIDMIVKGIDSTIKGVRQIINQLNEVRSETDQIDAGGFFEILESVNQYVTSSWSKFKSGDWAGAAFDAISSIVTIFTGIAKRKDKELQDSIKESEKCVKRLTNTYKDLERAVDKALGDDKFKAQNKLMQNIGHQMIEISKQADLERDKKNTDEDKVADLGREYVELGWQIDDILTSIKDDIIGSTAKDIAQELGDAMFEAFANGEDAAEAWYAKVDEIIGDLLKKMLISKFLEKPIADAVNKFYDMTMPANAAAQKITDQLNSVSQEISELDAGGRSSSGRSRDQLVDERNRLKKALDEQMKKAESEVPDMNKEAFKGLEDSLGNVGDNFQTIIDALPEDLKKYLFGTGEAGEGLKEGIKGVTEDTASLLASYLNAIRQHVATHGITLSNTDKNIAMIRMAVMELNMLVGNSQAMSTQAILHLKNIEANTFNTAAEAKEIAASAVRSTKIAIEISESNREMLSFWKDVTSGVKKINIK